MEGCNKYKLARTEGFCSVCFKANSPGSVPVTKAAPTATKAKATPNPTNQSVPASSKKKTTTSKKKLCKLEGCERYHQANCNGYCIGHAKLASQLSTPLPTKKSKHQKSLKPLIKARSAVYAAYWPPDDTSRETDPSWYPGVVSSYKMSKLPSEDRYGHVRYYNINFDDGDVLKNIPDHFVFAAEDYLLHLRHDDDDNKKGKKKPPWTGVKNVTDKRSKDQWAKHVGWYVATIEGEKHTFSLLSHALKAYDASVVKKKGVATRESSLNLPEDWEGLFTTGKKKMPPESMKSAAAKEGKRQGNPASKIPAGQIKPSEPATNIGPQWTREFFQTPQGASKCEYVSPTGARFKNVTDARKYVKLRQQMAGLAMEAEGASSTEASSKPAASEPTSDDKAEKNSMWTSKETELIIELDELYDGQQPKDKYKRMAETFPQKDEHQCCRKILLLRKKTNNGQEIGSILGITDIKTTLAEWSEEEIDLLMKLEEQNKDEEEDAKNIKIAQAIPRWESDKCSFKTRFMRWQTRVREEVVAKERNKRKREEGDKRKREEAAAKKNDNTLLSVRTSAATAKATAAAMKEDYVTLPPRLGFVKPGEQQYAPPPLEQRPGEHRVPAPPESKIDDQFIKILNNDPYLLSRCGPQTVRALGNRNLKSEES